MRNQIWLFISVPLLFTNLTMARTYFCKDILSYSHPQSIQLLLENKTSVLVAHGKNYNNAPESTWANLRGSLIDAQGLPIVLEMDLQITQDWQFIVSHDPTFHRMVKNYRTTQDKINAFWLEALQKESLYQMALDAERKGEYVFNLFDNFGRYSLNQIKSEFMIYDSKNNSETEFITLNEVLNSTSDPEWLQIPEYLRKIENEFQMVPQETFKLNNSVFFYFDLKPINNLARRYYQLSDWHWIRNSLSLDELENFTIKVIQRYSQIVRHHSAIEKTFIAARHPLVYRLIQIIDPEINVMISAENLTANSSGQDFIQAFQSFLINRLNPQRITLLEVKYLKHILDPTLRKWAEQNNLRLFYNEIKETDPSQFEGVYFQDPDLRRYQIFERGEPLWIQTNTVREMADYLLRKEAE